MVAVDDAGHLINPLIVEGQIHGGLAQGIGQAMIEEVAYGADGQPLTASFMDYAAAAGERFPALRARQHRHPDAGQSARGQGCRRGGDHRLDPLHRQCRGGRPERLRRAASRYDAAAREALAHHSRPVGQELRRMIPTAFEYERATSLDDALAKLAAAGGAGKLIAGGHSLVPLMKLRLSEPTVLIDIAHIPDFAGIREADGRIEIGAGTTHHDVATSALLRDRCPAVAETAALIGDQQVRNRADPRREPRARRSGGGLPGGDAGRRRGLPPEGAARLARRQGTGLLRGHADRRPGVGRDPRQGDVCAGAGGGLRQAAPARVAVRHRRRGPAALEVRDGMIASAGIGLTGASPSPFRLANVETALTGRSATSGTLSAATGSPGTASRTSTKTSMPARTTAAP